MIETDAGRGGPMARFSGKVKHLGKVAAAVTLSIGVLGTGVQTVAAYGAPINCSTPASTAAFARFGDTNSYFLVSNGGFENGAADWALSGGSSVVSGNESYFVNSTSDSHSLRIPAGAAAESRTICVARNQNLIRLFVNNQRVSGAILHIEAWAQNPDSGAWAVTAFDVNGNASPQAWNPTIQLQIPNSFGGAGKENLALKFTTRGADATWNVDDVYVDPFKNW